MTISLRPAASADDGTWIEHFYVAESLQGRGVGSEVLRRVLAGHPGPFRIDVLQGSAARRLYARHGSVHESEDGVDEYLVRAAG
ncbi:GNAT family N-acetyltransferase [Microbacteriaceae bacterium VKM Ac-2855]|nr:GNAT family N-acetyltransferase [Microbacteriaceae bacterium VKM Ac-2855]